MGTLIIDKSLVLNTLRGLNKRFTHMRTLLSMQRPMPTFLATRSALILEELKLGSIKPPPSVFITHTGKSGSSNSKSYTSSSSSLATGGGQLQGTSTNSTSSCSNGNNRRRITNRSNGGGSSFNSGGGRNAGPSSSQGLMSWPSF